MPVYRKRVDGNQADIVADLLTIPGVTVETDHDDILVGFRGKTFWFEIKSEEAVGADGKVKPSSLRPSQKRILESWTGHYEVVWSLDQILRSLGIGVPEDERNKMSQAA